MEGFVLYTVLWSRLSNTCSIEGFVSILLVSIMVLLFFVAGSEYRGAGMPRPRVRFPIAFDVFGEKLGCTRCAGCTGLSGNVIRDNPYAVLSAKSAVCGGYRGNIPPFPARHGA